MSIKIQTREESGVKWVSVDDMLPADGEVVLVRYLDEAEFGMIGGGFWYYLNDLSEWIKVQEPIKKWCHIPE